MTRTSDMPRSVLLLVGLAGLLGLAGCDDDDDDGSIGGRDGEFLDVGPLAPFPSEIGAPACLVAGGSELCSVDCSVIVEEVVLDPEKVTARRGHPSITLDSSCSPSIAFNWSSHSDHGRWATRLDDGWNVEATPFEAARLSAVSDALGNAYVLSDDGKQVSLWARSPDGWGEAEPIAAGRAATDAMKLGNDGTLHLAYQSGPDIVRATYDGGLQTAIVDSDGGLSAVLALGPTGNPWTAHWATDMEFFVEVASASDVLPTMPTGTELSIYALGLAVPIEGEPMVVYSAPGGVRWTGWGGAPFDVLLATRSSAACPGLPCAIDRHVVFPLAVVGSANSSRALYAATHFTGTSIEKCGRTMEAGQNCWAVDQPLYADARIGIAWLDESGELATTEVSVAEPVTGGTATVDDQGRIHVATRTELGIVRYLMIDAP